MTLAASSDYPLLNIFWTMLIFFLWILWIYLLVAVFSDLFRSSISGWAKVGWTVVLLILPYLGVLIYLVMNGNQMAQRRNDQVRDMQRDFDSHIRSVSGDGNAADQINKGKQLLDSGAISQEEFDLLKRKALAS